MKKLVLWSLWHRGRRHIFLLKMAPDSDGKFRLPRSEFDRKVRELGIGRGETIGLGV